MLDLLAQTGADPTSAAAWASGGAATLLGLILFWLAYYHLPAKDKQLVEFVQAKDKHITEVVNTFDNRVAAKDASILKLVDTTIVNCNEQRADFAASLDKVVNHCAEENAKARDLWQRSIEPKIREVVNEENAKALEKVLARQAEMAMRGGK